MNRAVVTIGLVLSALGASAEAKPVVRPDPLIATFADCSSSPCTLTLRVADRTRGAWGPVALVVEGPDGPQPLQASAGTEERRWSGPATTVVTLRGLDGRVVDVPFAPPTSRGRLSPATANDAWIPQWGAGSGEPRLLRGPAGGWKIERAGKQAAGAVVIPGESAALGFDPARGFGLPEPLSGDGRVWLRDGDRVWSWPLSPSGQLDRPDP